MEDYWIIFLIPIFWWILNISYQIGKLFKLWFADKILNLKELIK
tara:strand:- start:195 stop:326 length:132 start_codon:yes stop_codon:yes gene_type:complete